MSQGERPRADLADRVALTCRILAAAGHDDLCFGHVSARLSEATFLMKAPGLGLEEVGSEHVLLVPGDETEALHSEWPIHSEIYAARPDVGGIVHTHPLAARVLSRSPGLWRVTSNDALLFAGKIAFSSSIGLVDTSEKARCLAETLGGGRAVLLAGHGLVTVGATVEEATVAAVLLERELRYLLEAARLPGQTPVEVDLVGSAEQAEAAWPARAALIWSYLARGAG